RIRLVALAPYRSVFGSRRRARGQAGRTVRIGAGRDLPVVGAKVRRRQAGDRRGARTRARPRSRAAAGLPAVGGLPRRSETRPRRDRESTRLQRTPQILT